MALVTGLIVGPSSILSSPSLRFMVSLFDAVSYDWVRNLLQGRAFGTECECILAESSTAGFARKRLQEFVGGARWTFPAFSRAKSLQLYLIFDETRTCEVNPTNIKASCSELLSACGLIRLFFQWK